MSDPEDWDATRAYWDNYLQPEARVERLTAENALLIEAVESMHLRTKMLTAQVQRLQYIVDSLTKEMNA